MRIYQIYPRSFFDANGDGIGDLRGILAKLPYVARLGVDAIWISPFVQSPQKDFGYDVSDYCAVDPRFGTLEDFKRVLGKAHALGLKVLMDQVFCHCSDQHAWFKESRKNRNNSKADWFIWADARADGTPPNNWLSYFGGSAWSWDARRQQYYFHQFLDSQPTFNLRHPALRRALRAVCEFWLKMGVDGFRLDAIHTGFADPLLRNNPPRPKHMPPAPDLPENVPQAKQWRLHSEGHKDTLNFLQELRLLADTYGATLMGEVGGEEPLRRAATFTAGRKRLHMAYTFDLLKGAMDAKTFAKTVVQAEAARTGNPFCYALSNHDVARVASRWIQMPEARHPLPEGKSNPASDSAQLKYHHALAYQARLALVFGLLLPGHYCMYQGEELGLPQAEVPFEKMVDPFGLAFYPEFKGRDGCRTPMPWRAKAKHGGFSAAKQTWLPFAPEHAALAVDAQEADATSTLAFTRALISWCKAQPALQGDGFRPLKSKAGVVVFERHGKDQRLAAWFNFGSKTVSLPLPARARLVAAFSLGASVNKRLLRLPAQACALAYLDAGL